MLYAMARALIDRLTGSLEPHDDPTCRVAIAYQDYETGQHARNVCDFMTERMASECKFVSQMWRFDVLRIPECRDMAARGAAMADLIMVSSHGTGDLPGEVKAWIELWLRDKSDRVLALVALCDRPNAQSGPDWPVQDYLAAVAARAQIEFFAEPDIWPGRELHQEHLPLELGPIVAPPLPLAAVTLQSPDLNHWGINE